MVLSKNEEALLNSGLQAYASNVGDGGSQE